MMSHVSVLGYLSVRNLVHLIFLELALESLCYLAKHRAFDGS